MKIGTRLFLIVVVVAAGIWIWTLVHPSPDRVIRKRLAEVAKAASFARGTGYFANVTGAERLAGFFATNAEVDIDMPGHSRQSLSGREDILQTALGARATLKSLSVEFPDVTLVVNGDKESAIADLTAEGRVAGDSDMFIQEMKFTLKKIDGKWLITRVETVQTLQGGGG
jgi:hypothetical protein